MMAKLFVGLQYVVPKHWLTALVWRLARVRHKATKDFLIMRFVDWFDVDIADVKLDVPADFATFNDFFVRELTEGTRPFDDAPNKLISPVDGTVSRSETIEKDSIVQAKGIDYTLSDLLVTDLPRTTQFYDGSFATIYLAPYNYHRVHSPWSGKLVAANYVPGDLFSVNQATVARVDGLFRRNERLVMQFDTDFGPAALIFVGALNVGSISTPWSGEIRPRKSGVVDALDLTRHTTTIVKGDLLGWFNMGSTVILLLPPGIGEWRNELRPGTTLRMGESIGQLHRDRR